MENVGSNGEQRASIKSWLIIVGLSVGVLIWGFLIFFTVGDKGLPPWDYSILPDVPGQSVYSTHSAPEFSGKVPKPIQKDEVVRQHVMEPEADSKAYEVLGGRRP